MLPQSIDLINCISSFIFHVLGQSCSIISCPGGLGLSLWCPLWAWGEAPMDQGLQVLWSQLQSQRKKRSPKAQFQRSSALRSQEVTKQTSNWDTQKIKNFETLFYLVRLHLWWNWTRLIQLKEGGTCPHQMLQDPSFQLLHQMRKQELLLKLLKHCRGNNQQQVFPKAPVCWHHQVKLIILKVRG